MICAWSLIDAWRLRWLSDDAFISFRYAQNLVEGQGLVFNAGERVETNTSTIWTSVYLGITHGDDERLVNNTLRTQAKDSIDSTHDDLNQRPHLGMLAVATGDFRPTVIGPEIGASTYSMVVAAGGLANSFFAMITVAPTTLIKW